MSTIANQFHTNESVQKAKSTLLEQLQSHQSKITDIQGPQEDLKTSYEEALKSFGVWRGGNLALPYLSSGIGNGPLVELADGSIKYDMIIGIGVHFYGHSHPGLTEACLDASFADTVMQGNLQQDIQAPKLNQALLELANKNGAGFDHCFVTSTGVMGGENALKIAMQKRFPAKRILCLERCFMGRTIAMAQTTDNAAYRVGLPTVLHVDYIPFFDANDPQGSTERAVQRLKTLIKRYPNDYACMNFELVLGEGGFYPGDESYYKALMTILKENDIPILIDEVQSFGRTSEAFAFQHYNLDELVDVVWVGKASQACATLYRSEFKPKPGLLSQTYTASSTAVAAGTYIAKDFLNGNLFGKDGHIAQMRAEFLKGFEALEKKHSGKFQGPYGEGAMIAFQVGDGKPDTATAFVKALFENGVIAFMCGREPKRIRFLAPMPVLNKEHIARIIEILDQTLTQF